MSTLRCFSEKLARWATRWAGSTSATVLAFLVVVAWTAGGAVFFGFGDTYQLYINTGTTIVTFLMVFLIQRTQNKESLAMQLKLNELLAAHENADNRLIDLEDLSEADVDALRLRYQQLARAVKNARLEGRVSIRTLGGEDPLDTPPTS